MMPTGESPEHFRAVIARRDLAWHRVAVWVVSCLALFEGAGTGFVAAQQSLSGVVAAVQPHLVKIYGAGGVRGLEHYQSGMLISPDGHVLTVWSYVLDSPEVVVMLADGRRYLAEFVGSDPRLEIAVLKIAANDLQSFDLNQAKPVKAGTRVLAFSNLFNVATREEAVSVQHGIVAAVTNLAARRGTYQSPYRGQVLVLDAVTNNPGAAGGALTTSRGELVAMLGKELRSTLDNTWLNYAIPISELQSAVSDLVSGQARPKTNPESVRRPAEPMTLDLLGIVLVPDVLARTPPFIDRVRPESPAAKAGLQPDDLIVFLSERAVQSRQALLEELATMDRIDEVRLGVLRGQELLQISLFAPAANNTKEKR